MRALFAAVLAAFALQAQAQAPEPAHVDARLHLQFPAKLGELRYRKTVTYPNEGLGYCIVYEGKSSLAQICVYDFGHRKLPTGIDSKEFKEALQTAEDAVTRLIATPPYRNGQLIGTGRPEIAGEGRKAQAELRLFTSELAPPGEAPVQNVHLILMTTGLGKFLKLNYTARDMESDAFAEESKQLVQDFVEANAEAMKTLLK